jgi:glyoxylase I family protein
MHSLGIHHLAVHARAAGVEKVAAFYRNVVGLPELARNLHPDGKLRSIWLSLNRSADPSAGFLAVEDGDDFGPGMFALKIHAADRASLLACLGRHGIEVEKQTRWTVYVADPAGNHVAFSHHPHDPL